MDELLAIGEFSARSGLSAKVLRSSDRQPSGPRHAQGTIHHSAQDSRAYLFQEGQLSQLTRDHSFVQGLIDAGEMSAEHRRTHPRRALLTRALGMAPVVDPDISLPALAGSARILLCTDGLTAHADDTQLAAVLSAVTDPEQAAAELVQLANRHGRDDNTAVIVIDLTPN